MKYSRILLCMTALAACLLVGIAYGQDYLEGGYVRSHDRSMMDPGIASMLHWLDTPVPNLPWYSSDLAFYEQAIPDTTFSPFREYYTTTAHFGHRGSLPSISHISFWAIKCCIILFKVTLTRA